MLWALVLYSRYSSFSRLTDSMSSNRSLIHQLQAPKIKTLTGNSSAWIMGRHVPRGADGIITDRVK